MGVWGTGLYDDDVTCDLKEEYLNRLRIGMTAEEAATDLISAYSEEITDEEGIIYLALADVEWVYGRLTSDVKEKALAYIRSGEDLRRWDNDENLINHRKKVLKQLEEKLLSPMVALKKVGKIKLKRPKWNQGDILSIRITNDKLKEYEWYNKEVILEIVGVTRTNIGTLPSDKYYNEFNVAKVRGITDNLLIEKEQELPEIILSLSEREIKKLNIKIIDKNESRNDLIIMDCIRKPWVHSGNIEYTLVGLLNKLYKRH